MSRRTCKLPDGSMMTGNSEQFLMCAMEVRRCKPFTSEDIDSLRCRIRRHARRTSIAFLRIRRHTPGQAHQEAVDSLLQNQEARQVVHSFDVCEEHGGGGGVLN